MPGELRAAYAGRRVLVTGHTGFKGGWLALWLAELGAEVTGYSIDVPTTPSFFEAARLARRIDHRSGDVRDPAALLQVFEATRPEFVFHLAAQSLVRRSYREPVGTFATNLMGTVQVLEAARLGPSVRVCQIVTSDKCYRNDGRGLAFSEEDPMGGDDPYSASKGAAEIAVAAFRHSFACPRASGDGPLSISSARAGNVIGGGDWSEDRILPDCVRAWSRGKEVELRHPGAVRPWQHVLEAVSGYLWLAAKQAGDPETFAQAFNFGPGASDHLSVAELVEIGLQGWGGSGASVRAGGGDALPEAAHLALDASKAERLLGWRGANDVASSVRSSIAWYKRFYSDPDADMQDFSIEQIAEYSDRARSRGLAWAA